MQQLIKRYLPLFMGLLVLAGCAGAERPEPVVPAAITEDPPALETTTVKITESPTETSLPAVTSEVALADQPSPPTPVGSAPVTTQPSESDPATSKAAAATLLPDLIGACSSTPTPANPEGPFYKTGSPERNNLIESGLAGDPLAISGQVLSTDCRPIAGVKLDFWQADGSGDYDNEGYRLRGHQFSNQNGSYWLETVIPGEYPGRTPHIHVKIFGPDDAEWLTTQLYIPGLSDQITDGIEGFRPDLQAQRMPAEDGYARINFDFILSGR